MSQTASPATTAMQHQLPPRPSVHVTTASSSYAASPASASAPTPSARQAHGNTIVHQQQQQQQQQQQHQHQHHQQVQQQASHPLRIGTIDPATGLPFATTLANNPNRGKKPREGHNPYGTKKEETRAPPTPEELDKQRREREDIGYKAQIGQCTSQISVRKMANTATLNRLMDNALKEIDLKHQIAVLGFERRALELRKQLADEELARAQRGTWEDDIDMSWS
ncbi:hypothetical protein AURDEDRAFT_185156 [Auricularia subglabra TFB-10046 SS5]|nr:hypothetical protein AURDEDRAFT_185156 [Auricularia subglabra TFB-10046 SS5]